MKKIITLLLISIFFISSQTTASAKILTSKEGDINLEKKEIINDDLIIGAKNVTLDNTTNGDVFVGAEKTTINGTINGNLHIGSGDITLKGKVKGNVYLGSGNITIVGSSIDGSLLMGAGTVIIDKDSVIKGSVMAGVGKITIDSKIGRNLYLGAGTANIQDNTKVGKDLYYAYNESDNKISISDKAVVSGETHRQKYNVNTKTDTKTIKKQLLPLKSAATLMSFISAFVIGLVYFKLFNKHLAASSEVLSKQFWKSLGIGFLIFITLVPAIIILLITIVGIPVIGVSLLMLIVFVYLSKFIVSLSLGTLIVKKFKWSKVSKFWTFTLGLLVIYLLKMVPALGGIVSFLIVTSGLGALTINLFQQNK